ncbi:MAG: RagB/SusD family nutrient uptake outer membrane protein [Tannerella sp.]|jgi:hypothetical protein|nr:RagB/SusD family nutrient uptake outer membrane protein [Tannerella sp.]
MKKYVLLIFAGILMFSSCEDLFTPASENFKDVSQMYTDAKYAQGFLIFTYRSIPAYYDNSDYATDDAVTNQKSNNFLKMATGAWTAASNPVDKWVGFGSIQSINQFLENADKVKWADDEEPSNLFKMRMKGEAYGMRALFMYYLLQSHVGYTDDGRLMGIPIVTEFQDAQSDFNRPRATFEECVQQIYQDLDSADYYLPMEYENINSDSEIPARFQSVTKRKEVYNRVMGQYARQLYNGLIAKAFRARVSLLAASPAFQDASNTTAWADAADNAAAVIDYIGGVGGLDPDGATYYANTSEIDELKEGINPKEIIWRENLSTNNSTQESQNFPPSLFGSGYMNPTQNLVDAFPMASGYPITDPRGFYNANNPYSGRDPRLSMYIIYNGSEAGTNNSVINTGSQSGTDDGINKKETSTRTGYYMKKRLRMDVNCNPSSTTAKTHYTPRIRYTEMFLAYAESANEAYGPTGKGRHSYSAYDIIKAIRTRAGVGVNNGDPYLEECMADQDKMRTLIRNERRLELCFESFRFWDLRRWKINLNETAHGMDISAASDRIFDVENRSYEDYMYYGPIPFSETLKYSNLVQNKGWK